MRLEIDLIPRIGAEAGGGQRDFAKPQGFVGNFRRRGRMLESIANAKLDNNLPNLGIR